MELYNLEEKLVRYMDSGFPIIFINSFEDEKVDKIIRSAACGRKILEWNGCSGLVDFDTKVAILKGKSIESSLELFILDNRELEKKVIVLKDSSIFLDNVDSVALLKGIVKKINCGIEANIIIVSSILQIPKELEPFITILEMDYVGSKEIYKIIREFIECNSLKEINSDLMREMSIAFKGLSEFEIKNILALAYSENGELTRKDLSLIFDQKQQTIKKSGILEMIPLKESMDDIGGLEILKQWLIKKGKVFKNIESAQKFGVDIPKGVLIAGVPGCGKSLNAKATAKCFEVPLLRLDMSRIMGKYVGESEGNMRKAIALAEAISPCVLWIDELEKSFAGTGNDGGSAEVTTRLLGNFLTWLQEKESSVFVVATANDITKLPPELLRKGRFDEIFYVELPKEVERKKIFEIHISKRRKKDLQNININKLVSETAGYSGADIEGVVKESIEQVFIDCRNQLATDDILKVISTTHSLSEIMKVPLEKMSNEYKNRKFKNASK